MTVAENAGRWAGGSPSASGPDPLHVSARPITVKPGRMPTHTHSAQAPPASRRPARGKATAVLHACQRRVPVSAWTLVGTKPGDTRPLGLSSDIFPSGARATWTATMPNRCRRANDGVARPIVVRHTSQGNLRRGALLLFFLRILQPSVTSTEECLLSIYQLACRGLGWVCCGSGPRKSLLRVYAIFAMPFTQLNQGGKQQAV